LTAVLESLATQEADCIRAGDFASVRDIQRRAGVVVDFLTRHEREIHNRELRTRIAKVVAYRDHTCAELQSRIDATRAQLDAVQANRRRVSRIAPAYTATPSVRHRFAVSG
jgi:hypothetical protein